MIDIDEAREKFDNFLMIMDDQLEAIEAEARSRGIALELTIDSLENLEKLFFDVTKNSSEEEKQGWIVTFSRYLGEIARVNYSGEWKLSLEDPKNVHYNTPVIINHTKMQGLEFSPIHAMRALSLRKKIGMLRQILMADIQPRRLGIDHLEER